VRRTVRKCLRLMFRCLNFDVLTEYTISMQKPAQPKKDAKTLPSWVPLQLPL
jgi:hypothetical protein